MYIHNLRIYYNKFEFKKRPRICAICLRQFDDTRFYAEIFNLLWQTTKFLLWHYKTMWMVNSIGKVIQITTKSNSVWLNQYITICTTCFVYLFWRFLYVILLVNTNKKMLLNQLFVKKSWWNTWHYISYVLQLVS